MIARFRYLNYHQGPPAMPNMHNPAHPGQVLREYLPENISVTEASARLAISRQALSAILNGRAGVSADMALRLAAALGTSPEIWLSMQTAYDLWQAKQRPQPKISRFVKAA